MLATRIAPQTRSDPRNPWIAIAYLYRFGKSNAEPFCSLFNPRQDQLRRLCASKETEFVSRTVQYSHLGGEIICGRRDST
jgi:hypothetical protein